MSSKLPDRISDYAESLQIDHRLALKVAVSQINKDLQLTGIDYELVAENVAELQDALDDMLISLQRRSLELLTNFLYRADIAPDKVPLFLDTSKASTSEASIELVKRVLERVRFRLQYHSSEEHEEE